jgi:hypothetical protein
VPIEDSGRSSRRGRASSSSRRHRAQRSHPPGHGYWRRQQATTWKTSQGASTPNVPGGPYRASQANYRLRRASRKHGPPLMAAEGRNCTRSRRTRMAMLEEKGASHAPHHRPPALLATTAGPGRSRRRRREATARRRAHAPQRKYSHHCLLWISPSTSSSSPHNHGRLE